MFGKKKLYKKVPGPYRWVLTFERNGHRVVFRHKPKKVRGGYMGTNGHRYLSDGPITLTENWYYA